MNRLSVPWLCGGWLTVFSLASAPYVSAQSPRPPFILDRSTEYQSRARFERTNTARRPSSR